MKIVHLITSLKIGGAEVALFNKLKNFNLKSDEHIVIYFYAGPILDKIKTLGVKTYQVKGAFSVYDPISLLRVYRLIKKLSPDLINTALWSANIIGRLVGRKLKTPVISEIHGDVFYQGAFRNFIDRSTIFYSQYIVVVSKSVKKSLEDNFISKIKSKKKKDTLQSRIVLIQNGVDLEELKSKVFNIDKKSLGFEEDDFVIGSVGRLEPIKSYDLLLKAFALSLKDDNNKDRKLKLCLIGDGSQKEYLQKLAIDLNVESRVNFVGWQNDPIPFYQLFDCFVLSSQSEGLSISLLEALAFGLPLVSTHIVGLDHDVILDKENGFLVPLGDVDLLSQSLNQLYDHPILTAKMGKKSKELSGFFDIRYIIKKYYSLYNKCKVLRRGH